MQRSERLQVVLKLTALREQEALRQLGVCQQQLLREQQRLNEVEQYCLEYQRNFQTMGQQRMDGMTIQRYRLFISKLETAIGQQRQQIGVVTQNLKRAKDHWHLMHSKHKAMESLVEKCRRAEVLVAARKEQKESDERSSQRKIAIFL